MKKIYLFFLFVPIIVWSQTKDPLLIHEVVISDSINKDVNVKKITEDEKLARTTSDLLRSQIGVSVTKRSVFAEEPVINAFRYNQVNVVKNDGARANSSCPNHMDPPTTRIAPNEINKIIVVQGPYEVRYGQILGGMVRLVSDEKPEYEKFQLNGNLGGQYHSNSNGISSGINLNGGSKKYDFRSFANYRKFGNYKSGDGTEIASSFETYAFGLNLAYNLSKNQRFVADWSYSKANDIMHAGLPMDAEYDISNMFALDYSLKLNAALLKQVKVKIYASDEDHLMTNVNRPNAHIATAYTPVTSRDYGARIAFDINLRPKIKMFSGADLAYTEKDGHKEVTMYKNVCTSPVTVLPIPKEKEFSVWQKSSINDAGLFSQFKYFYNSKTLFEGGARLDYVATNVLEPEKDFDILYNYDLKPDEELNVNAFLKVKYQIFKNQSLQLAVGRGTRNASLLEKYINHFTIGLDAYEYVGNPNLESEVNHQIDLIYTYRKKTSLIYANVFYSRISNYITAEVDTSIDRKFTPCKSPQNAKRFVNADLVDQYGFKLGFEYAFLKHFYTGFNLTYIHATNLELDEALAEVPPLNMMLKLGYKKNKFKFELNNEFQAEQTHVASSLGENETPSFYILNFDLSYKFFKSLKVGVAVANVFDHNYYQHLSRPYKNMEDQLPFYEPGRNFVLKLNYSF